MNFFLIPISYHQMSSDLINDFICRDIKLLYCCVSFSLLFDVVDLKRKSIHVRRLCNHILDFSMYKHINPFIIFPSYIQIKVSLFSSKFRFARHLNVTKVRNAMELNDASCRIALNKHHTFRIWINSSDHIS